MLLRLRVCQVPELLQQQGVLEDALDGLDEVGLERAAVLLPRVACGQELAQRLVALICRTTDDRTGPSK